jgi:U3 small nucleolar RNA-associated protein 18
VDGKVNAKVQSVFINDMPIFSAKFNPSGNEVILTGRRPFFYVYNLDSGKADRIDRIIGKYCVAPICLEYPNNLL